MKRLFVAVLAAVAVIISGVAVSVPAHATFGDSRTCVTGKEYRAIKKGMSRDRVKRILDGAGTRVNGKTRQYTKCGWQQQRVVRVSYDRKYRSTRARVAGRVQIVAVPSAPRQIEWSAGDGSVRVSWQAPSSSGGASISGYTVRYRKDYGPWREVSTSSRSLTVSGTAGCSSCSTYDVEVAARNQFGFGAWEVSTVEAAAGIAAATSQPIQSPGVVRGTLSGDDAASYSFVSTGPNIALLLDSSDVSQRRRVVITYDDRCFSFAMQPGTIYVLDSDDPTRQVPVRLTIFGDVAAPDFAVKVDY